MPYILSHPGSYEVTFSTMLEEDLVILSGEKECSGVNDIDVRKQFLKKHVLRKCQ